MQKRRDIWARLKPDTHKFVYNYLKNSLNLEDGQHENFLFPDYEKTLLDPSNMHDGEKAAERVLKAVLDNEKICIYGDYDCDGVPGTAMFQEFLQKIGYKNFICYIPDRHKEGYGLNVAAIDFIKSEAVSLIITIDLGTTNISEVDYANSLQIDTIITDHHLPLEIEDGEVLPKAYAIVNNKKRNCNYANKDLCGSGTVFKLIVLILEKLRNLEKVDKKTWQKYQSLGLALPAVGYEKWLLDLVAVATVADMVPLTHENRTLVIYGLHVLSMTKRSGLHTLFKNAKSDLKYVDEKEIGFTLAPRINSASRMATPTIALDMLGHDILKSVTAAHKLEELNKNRKDSTKNILKSIYKILDERLGNSPVKKLPEIVVVGSGEWGAGILGILASKVLDKYSVNVFVFGGEDEEDSKNKSNKLFKGSCRSRGDIHLVKLMSSAQNIQPNIFEHFGGHELAGGFSISFDKLHELENILNTQIEAARIKNLVQMKKDVAKSLCLEIPLYKLDAELLAGLGLIGPFGVGNPRPIFKITNVLGKEVARFGKNKEHLKIILSGKNIYDKQIEREAIKFFVDEKEEQNILSKLEVGDIYYEIEKGFMTSVPRLNILI